MDTNILIRRDSSEMRNNSFIWDLKSFGFSAKSVCMNTGLVREINKYDSTGM